MMPTVKHNAGFPDCVSLSIEFNQHASSYEDVAAWVESAEATDWLTWVSPEERQMAIDTDSVWVCQWYPDTPVGFVALAASTFEALMAAVNDRRVLYDRTIT